MVVCVALVTLLVLIGLFAPHERLRPTPSPRSPSPRSARVAWNVTPQQLRHDLTKPGIVASIDGAFDESHVAEEAGLWLTVTGAEDDSDTVVHALDPATGKLRWQRRLEGALCATRASAAGIVCASVLNRDPTTGLGIRWRLHLIDPGTGRDVVARDVRGWLTAVHGTGHSFVVLEQRQPSPHAVVTAYRDGDLRPLWTEDLAKQPGQKELFSADRITERSEPKRPGLALDRPRFREVGSGLLAIWAGQRTAFIDVASGKLIMMPHCSRLVDDGSRLWCNETDGASAYSYAGRRLFRVRGPRLAFPNLDPNADPGPDRSQPVFIDSDGAGVAVDPTSGKVGAVYTPPGRGSAFGLTTLPATYSVGTYTFLIGEAGTLLLDPERHRVIWRNPTITTSDLPMLHGDDEVLLGAYQLDAVDLISGVGLETISTGTSYTVALGDRIAGADENGISLLRI